MRGACELWFMFLPALSTSNADLELVPVSHYCDLLYVLLREAKPIWGWGEKHSVFTQ